MKEAILAERKKQDQLVQEMRGRHKDSYERLASRFQHTLTLKENLEGQVKDLEWEVQKLQPVCYVCGYVVVGCLIIY
jgi:hypothetical protein